MRTMLFASICQLWIFALWLISLLPLVVSSKQPLPKVILVTGSSSGIGKMIAEELVQQGRIVYGAARRVKKIEQDLGQHPNGHAVKVDVTNSRDIQRCLQKIWKEQGRLDCLINNAGYGIFGPAEEVSLKDAQRLMDVNVFGAADCIQQAIPYMRRNKDSTSSHTKGMIINVSSVAGRIYAPFFSWYVASKHALEGWSDTLRVELQGSGIQVVIVRPGFIRTEFHRAMTTTSTTWKSAQTNQQTNKPWLYQDRMDAVMDKFQRLLQRGSSPQVVAKTIARVVNTQRPKRRYVVGFLARPKLLFRALAGDALMDQALKLSYWKWPRMFGL